ncbi:unnamed protein product [Adineta steineri]|uniref:Uncharacterized protein n=1 Tax=Adineta steineri TaxID=433720 RepID=A0A815FY58_9BILA|nr:unnamed protein product [Adineta steineri]CAF1331401.1 unnamed protein product [Adineta steineri]
MKPQSRSITISNITPDIFEELHLKHGPTLLCPCSNASVPYKIFISNTITHHPVCSSIFVSQQWIQALYLVDASSQDTVLQNQKDFNNSEFVTINLLHEVQFRSEVNGIIEFFKNGTSSQILTILNYLRTTTRANYLLSALNTNAVITTYIDRGKYVSHGLATAYYPSSLDDTSAKAEKLLCNTQNPIGAVGFFEVSSQTLIDYHEKWHAYMENNVPLVNGFFGSCTPLEGLLSSTLACLYDSKCIDLLIDYFPAINQIQPNWTDSVLYSKYENVSVEDLTTNLFIEAWLPKTNYSEYFHECAPSRCTYTTTDYTDFSYAVILLISLYGGLTIILRLIAPFLINISLKFKRRLRNTTVDSGSFLVLLLFTSLNTQTATITVQNPSLTTYNDLQVLYLNTLRCPCSTMIIPHRTIISLSPILHQICASDFLDDRWILILEESQIAGISIDWRNRAHSQFRLLSELCELANKTIDDHVHRFLSQPFIASAALTEFEFETQLNATLDQFYQSTTDYFGLLVETVRLVNQVDQPFTGSSVIIESDFVPDLAVNMMTDEITNQKSLQVIFRLFGTQDPNSTLINCICATGSLCQSPATIHDIDLKRETNYSFTVVYTIPGWILGCSPIDSILLSTLECFYSGSDCLEILMDYLRDRYCFYVKECSSFDFGPLIYNSSLSRFPPKTLISSIVKKLMIERWNPSLYYDRFYELCAPTHCTYSKSIREKTAVGVMITLVSLISGLTVSLRLITPQLVKLIMLLVSLIKKKRQRQQKTQLQGNRYTYLLDETRQSIGYVVLCLVRSNWCNKIKAMMQKLGKLIYNTVVDLNLFPARNFSSHINPMTAKRLGEWTTRLYIILFIVGLFVLLVYTIARRQTVTKTFNQPSFILYNRLHHEHQDKLECSCSFIASKFKRFVEIEAKFHQICSSSFVLDEWQKNLTNGLVSDLSVYEQRDYRRFLSSHLQFLQGLCQISINSVNDSINQFLSSLFITTKLLSENDFRDRVDLLFEQSQLSAPITFGRLYSLIASINHGNAIISSFGSNFEYIAPFYQEVFPYAPTQAIIYDECSCGLYPNCTTEANFIGRGHSKIHPIKGLKMGCIPSESFRSSTLECFYDESCVQLIRQYTNYTNRIIPLNATKSRFLINTSVAELMNNLFIEEWSKTINYSLYFANCFPSFCSYSYIEKINLLYIVTVLLALQGGLSIILKWICPLIVRLLFKLYYYRKNRRNIIQPDCSLQVTTINVDNTNILNLPSNSESNPSGTISETNIVSPIRCSFKVFLIFILMIIVVIGLIIFTISLARHAKSKGILTPTNTTTTRRTVVPTCGPSVCCSANCSACIYSSTTYYCTRYWHPRGYNFYNTISSCAGNGGSYIYCDYSTTCGSGAGSPGLGSGNGC